MAEKKVVKSIKPMTYAAYKRELQKAAKEWFVKNNFETEEKNLFNLKSSDMWSKNIICTDVAECVEKEKHERKLRDEPSLPEPFLHSQFHNGLSSQAMLVNLVGPLIVRNDLDPLRIAFKEVGIPWPTGKVSARLEHEDKEVLNEKHGTPTSIDLVIFEIIVNAKTKKKSKIGRIFVEAKLNEPGFRGCSSTSKKLCKGKNPLLDESNDCSYKKGQKYWQLMEIHGFKETADASKDCPFAKHYQFFRELLFALEKKGSFVLLYDERRTTFRDVSQGAKESDFWPSLMKLVPEKHASSIFRVTIQQIVKAIEDSGRHQDWIGEFKEKYAIE